MRLKTTQAPSCGHARAPLNAESARGASPFGRSLAASLMVGLALALLAWTAVAFASAPTGSIKLHGPTAVTHGQKFHITITGHVSTVHKALRVQVYEQTPAGQPCAASDPSEFKRAGVHPQGGGFIMQRSYSVVKYYRANSPVPTHRFCAYLSRFSKFIHGKLVTQTIASAGSGLVVSYQ